MKALIIIAHGSRRQQSNNEIVEMVNTIRNQVTDHYPIVMHSYLEICAPSLPVAVADAIGAGAKDISVYPFFLNSGNHVERDIPQMIEELNEANSDCVIRLMPHFGEQANIAALITRHVMQ